MAENSTIEWTDHTFNPWRGCTKVSAGCKNCYAETQAKRNPGVLGIWGDKGTRVVAAESYWRKPLQWNANARTAGARQRVFCASMADVFEDRAELQAPRLRLLRLIYDTPHLDWLLLTKRPENIERALSDAHTAACYADDLELADWLFYWAEGTPPANVWLGTSVENQEQADARIPHLLAAPAAVRFLSCEPLLGPVNIDTIDGVFYDGGMPFEWQKLATPGISWVIVGGESGPKARPMHPDWARSLCDQCQAAGAAFFFKQWGEWAPAAEWSFGVLPHNQVALMPDGAKVSNDDNPDEEGGQRLLKVGKHTAGRLLDGRTWDEFPTGKEVVNG